MEYISWIKINYVTIACTLLFACFGYFGIPVPIPSTAHQWAWTVMYNHRVTSILLFSVFGFLIGLTIISCSKKQPRSWAYGCFSGVLLIAIVISYKTLALNNYTMWNQVQTGFARVSGVATEIQKGQIDSRQGVSLAMAAANIGIASRYFGLQRQNDYMDAVASALTQAGFYLTVPGHEQDESITYIERCFQIIQDTTKMHHGMLTPALAKQIITKMHGIIPKDFNQYWFPY